MIGTSCVRVRCTKPIGPASPIVIDELRRQIRPLTPHETLDLLEYIELLEQSYL